MNTYTHRHVLTHTHTRTHILTHTKYLDVGSLIVFVRVPGSGDFAIVFAGRCLVQAFVEFFGFPTRHVILVFGIVSREFLLNKRRSRSG